MKWKKPGFTLFEILVASGIAAVVLVTAFGTVGNIYFLQKRVTLSQNFYDESRIVLERLAKLSCNNTIDYNRFFEEVGPDTTLGACEIFDADQLPGAAATDPVTVRATQAYPRLFYWDSNDDGIQDRNLGGKTLTGEDDPCTVAFQGDLSTLYLINGDRTIRLAIRENAGTLEVQRQLGFDSNGDGRADEWSHVLTSCQYNGNDPLGGTDLCGREHDWTVISPPSILVESFVFVPSPSRDPFLAFRVEAAQRHPSVFLSLQTSLAEFEKYGFSTAPEISLHTSTSSRVFGNTRK